MEKKKRKKMKNYKFEAIHKFKKIRDIVEMYNYHQVLDQIADEKNVLIINNISKRKYEVCFFIYIDWFPHIAVDQTKIFNNGFQIEFFRLLEYISLQDDNRKWNIFENNKKVNLEFEDFIIQFVVKNPNINLVLKNKFISEYLQDSFNCINCEFYSNFKLGEYLICIENSLQNIWLGDNEKICKNYYVVN
jgi:hypothetical protein